MISLVKVRINRDLSFVFDVMSQPKEAMMFLRRCRINSFEEFENWFCRELDHFYDSFYMIQNEEHNNIGFLYSYDYKPVDQHVYISVYICPEYQKLGAGIEASILFADSLFFERNLRKIYSCVYGYNEESLRCNLQAGFVEEGRLKEDRYYRGEFWDTYIFAITKIQFYEKYEQIIQRFEKCRT